VQDHCICNDCIIINKGTDTMSKKNQTTSTTDTSTTTTVDPLHGAMAPETEKPELSKLRAAVAEFTQVLANTRDDLLSAREGIDAAKTIGVLHREAFEKVMQVEGVDPLEAVGEAVNGIGRYVNDWVAGNPMPILPEGVKQSESEEFKTWRDAFNANCYHPVKRSTEKVLMKLVLAGTLPPSHARIAISAYDKDTKAPSVKSQKVEVERAEHDVVAEAAKFAIPLLDKRHEKKEGELVYNASNKPVLVAASADRRMANMENFVLALTQKYRYADLIAAIEKAKVTNGDI
jgi:hypothetical protein